MKIIMEIPNKSIEIAKAYLMASCERKSRRMNSVQPVNAEKEE
jgi:hypothetical protein